MLFVIGSLIFVVSHIAAVVCNVRTTFLAFALARLVEALLVRASIVGCVGHTIDIVSIGNTLYALENI